MQDRKMSVTRRRDVADGVVEIELTPQDADQCPSWEAGAHVDLVLPSGLVRQYSICGGAAGEYLTVAVLVDDAGRGGSREVRDHAHPGTVLTVRGPRNHFRLEPAEQYVFVAGGIGITPILAMIKDAVDSGARWSLYYGGRSRSSMAYVAEVEQLGHQSAGRGRVELVPQDERGLLNLEAAISAAPDTAAIYACGPEPMLRALEDHLSGSDCLQRLHLERFSAAEKDSDAIDDGALQVFEVELASSGEVLTVGPDERIIDAVRTLVPDMPFSCEEGYCGSCETGVLEGRPCHRDQLLNQQERDAGDVMMICVGRSFSDRLVLDL